VQLATGVLLIPQRHPVHLAKELATLDRMSGGRAVLGVGVGYMEQEFGALGVPMASRGRRADEYLAAMRELWTSARPSFHGEFVTFEDIESRPPPVRAGGPPLVVGGHSDAALARAARLGDGWLGWHMRPEQAARKAARLAGLARPADRGPLEISVMPPERVSPELVVAYADAGVDRIIVTPAPGLDPARLEAFVRRNAPGEMGAVSAAPG
jgi:probable F420-dependent oxidoreductase